MHYYHHSFQCRSFGSSKEASAVPVFQSSENTITTTPLPPFKRKDTFPDLLDAIQKMRTGEDKSAKQTSDEAEAYPSLAALLHMPHK